MPSNVNAPLHHHQSHLLRYTSGPATHIPQVSSPILHIQQPLPPQLSTHKTPGYLTVETRGCGLCQGLYWTSSPAFVISLLFFDQSCICTPFKEPYRFTLLVTIRTALFPTLHFSLSRENQLQFF